MSSIVEPSRSRAVSRIAIMAALAAGVAGCSSDFSRFSENPYRGGASQEVTGSVRPQQQHSQHAYQPAPSQRVESASLPPPGGAQAPSYGGSPGPVASAQQPTYGGSGGIGYQPPARQDITGSVQAPRQQPPQPQQNWSWDGGTAVIVAQGETVDTISRRHGVPPHAILQANNMTYAAQLKPGQRLVIPRVQHQMTQAPQATPPATRPAPAIAAANGTHTIAPGETIYSLGRKYGLTPMAIAKANNIGLDHKVKVGERLVIPGQGGSAPRLAAPAPQLQQPAQRVAAAPAPAAPAPVATKPQAAPKVAQNAPKNEAAPTANIVAPAADPLPEPQSTGTTGGSSSVSFRWPVKGHINEKFGPRQNGGQNDGINIAVPQGTPIKAAEDGVVAYAGSELKGYGNLVLVRHSNGYVTAYAHASELNVKKGETVKRGQMIGKAGQTGNVNSPQLHFEVRKGATPVDPTQYLTGG